MKKSELRRIVKESVRTFLIEQATGEDEKLSRAFGGRPLPKAFNEFKEVCLKKIVPGETGGQGSGTACAAPPCGNCGSCTCIELKPVTKTRMGEREIGGGASSGNICIKNVVQSGLFNQNLTFDNCGPCKANNACPGDCYCIGPKKSTK